MKKKIAILGSTGSIGKTLFKILLKEKNNFDIVLLAAHKSHNVLIKQAKVFNVKNLIITNKKSYEVLKKETRNTNIRVFNDFTKLNKIFKKKIDYVMSSVSGIQGLEPTIKLIKFTKKIAIANKESIICGWNLIQAELDKYKTEFIPVDSEHFSIWYGLKNSKTTNLEKIFLTASGGPFYKTPLSKFNKIKVTDALNTVGKSISGSQILILGLAYKKNIDDLRESPSLELIDLLLQKGALVDYSDPYISETHKTRKNDFKMKSVSLTKAMLNKYDLVLLATDHDDFDYNLIEKESKLIVDTRGKFNISNNIIKA